jgi:hypothetical protein
MTREETLALYRPIRASVRRILKEAVGACNPSDLKRAAKVLGLWVNEKIALPEEEGPVEMLSDIALFEPNQRGRRAFDVFLSERASRLDATDADLAQRMGHAFFSLFRYAGPHESGGIWLENLFEGNNRLWLMDERMEETAASAGAFGMRMFDAGPFHVGFGIAAPTDEETAEFAVQGTKHSGRPPFRYSLAATLYGDSIHGIDYLALEIDEAAFDSFTTTFRANDATKRPSVGDHIKRRGLLPKRQRRSVLGIGCVGPLFHFVVTCATVPLIRYGIVQWAV